MTRRNATSHAGSRPDHFVKLAARWSCFGPPLRPSPEDVAVAQAAVDALAPGSRAALLGLTPEIVGCRFPPETRLTAVDHSAAMIRALWRPEAAPAGARVLEAAWTDIPVDDGAFDLVLGDGCFLPFDHPEGYAALAREVRRVLAPAGRFVIRVFLRPEVPESLAAIAAALQRGEIGSVHALKLRLIAVLHGASGHGTRLGDVWSAWKTLPATPDALLQRPGWTEAERSSLESYRELETRYFLPSLAELRAVLLRDFEEAGESTGTYELASRCPTFTFTPRAPSVT